MFKIGKLFHLTHVVDNLRAADEWYDDVFSACRYYRGYMRAAMRNASVLAIGDTPFEAIQTAPVPGAENSAMVSSTPVSASTSIPSPGTWKASKTPSMN